MIMSETKPTKAKEALIDKEETNPSAGLIYKRIANVMVACPEIGKDMKNEQQHFSFRGIDQFYNALHKIMAENQVFSTSKIVTMNEKEYEGVDRNGQKRMMYSVSGVIGYTFWTVDGSSVYTEVMTKGMDYGDKDTNKAMSIAHKYALIQIFAIATDEPDPDSELPEVLLENKKVVKSSTDKPIEIEYRGIKYRFVSRIGKDGKPYKAFVNPQGVFLFESTSMYKQIATFARSQKGDVQEDAGQDIAEQDSVDIESLPEDLGAEK